MDLVVYSFFTWFEDEGREWMIVIVCKERDNFKKKKIDILMKYSVK